jgi:DNA repair protein SbcD/Mre11
MKILHTADIHIGYDTHGRLDAKTGLNSRLLDFENCFKFMVSIALDEDIDLFLFCGDAYRDSTPTPTEQRIFARALRPLLDKQIPIVMLVGNHDNPGSFGKANSIQIFPDLHGAVRLFTKPDTQEIQTKSGRLRIVGLPWAMRSSLFTKEEHADKKPEELKQFIYEAYTRFIDAEAERIRDEKLPYPAILAAHLHVQGAEISEKSEVVFDTKDPLFAVSALAKKEFSYVALGHIHKHQDLNLGETPPVVYSGSIERISFSEWKQPKGFVIVEIDHDHRATYRHVETPARAFVSIEVNVKSSDAPLEKIEEAISKKDIQDAIVRVRIDCTTEQRKEILQKDVQKFLTGASAIGEISITSDEETARRRAVAITQAMSVQEALAKYILERPDLEPLKEKLLAKALEIEHEAQN